MAALSLRRLVLAVALLSVPATPAALGWKYQPKGKPVEYRGHFATLPSGMRIVVYEMPQVDRFALTISYRAGSVDDPSGKEGLAHLVEHLAFRGAPGGPGAPRVWERLVASGMRFNAFTAMDHTNFWIAGKPNELGLALDIEASRMKDPLAGVGDDEFAIERDVVVAEWRERHETVDKPLFQWMREMAFAGHPYGRAATPESLRTITLGDATTWTKARYDPAGAIVVVVSPLPAEDAARRVIEAFGPLGGDPAHRRDPMPYEPPKMPGPPAPAEAIATRAAPVEQPELWVAWPVPGSFAGLEPHTQAVAAIVESRLLPRLAPLVRSGAVDDAQVLVDFMDGAGLLAVRVILHDAEKAGKALETVRFAVGELRLGVTRDEMVPIRDALLVDAYMDLEDPRMHAISDYVRATGKPDFLASWARRVSEQVERNVAGFAGEWLTSGRSSALLVVPDRNLRAHDLAGGPTPAPAYVDPLEDEAATLPPPSPERLASVLRTPGLARAERRTLANGLDVAFLQQGSLPVADVRVVLKIPAEGSAAAPLGAPLLALSSSSASFVGEKALGSGLTRSRRRGPDSLVLVDRGSSGNLADILETEGRWARKVSLSGPVFEIAKDIYARVHEIGARAPLERTRTALLERLFPNHPYGSVVNAGAIRALSSRQSSAWLDGAIRPERASLLVVSNVAPSPEGWKWIESEFGGWKRNGAGPVPPAPIAPLPATRSAVVVERRGATQALVAVGFRIPVLAERDAPAVEAARWLLASRLNQRIRVEEGVSYGVSVGVLELRQAAALVIAAVVDAEAATRAVRTILQAAQDLAAQPLAPAAAARARWMVARRFASAFETVGDAADALEMVALHGLPQDYWDRMPSLIASLDATRIQAAARALALGHEVIVVSADRTVCPQLAAASLAPELIEEPTQ